MGAALRRESWPTRLAVLGITVAIFLGSLLLVALPLAWPWLLSNLDISYLEVYFLALIGCPTALVGGVMVLLKLNSAYTALSERDGRPVLEASITLAVLVAIAALVFWVVVMGSEGGPNQGPWPA